MSRMEYVCGGTSYCIMAYFQDLPTDFTLLCSPVRISQKCEISQNLLKSIHQYPLYPSMLKLAGGSQYYESYGICMWRYRLLYNGIFLRPTYRFTLLCSSVRISKKYELCQNLLENIHQYPLYPSMLKVARVRQYYESYGICMWRYRLLYNGAFPRPTYRFHPTLESCQNFLEM